MLQVAPCTVVQLYGRTTKFFRLDGLLLFRIVMGLRWSSDNILLFSFFIIFILLCDLRKVHHLTREFRFKLHWKTDIALIASRYRFLRAI